MENIEQEQEHVTEMLTLVVTPSMRARIEEISNERFKGKYAKPCREALQRYLDTEAPRTPEEIKALTDGYTARRDAYNASRER